MSILNGYPTPQPVASTPGCSVCHSRDVATVDIYNGRRCTNCPPMFSGAVVVLLTRAEGVRAALAYLRTYAAIEAAA